MKNDDGHYIGRFSPYVYVMVNYESNKIYYEEYNCPLKIIDDLETYLECFDFIDRM